MRDHSDLELRVSAGIKVQKFEFPGLLQKANCCSAAGEAEGTRTACGAGCCKSIGWFGKQGAARILIKATKRAQ